MLRYRETIQLPPRSTANSNFLTGIDAESDISKRWYVWPYYY